MPMLSNLMASSKQCNSSEHRQLKSSRRAVFRSESISVLMETFFLRIPHQMTQATLLSELAQTLTPLWECPSSCSLGRFYRTWVTITPLTTRHWPWCFKTSKISMSGPWQTLSCSLPFVTQGKRVSRRGSHTTCSKLTRRAILWRKTRWISLRLWSGRPILITTRGPSERTTATSIGSRSSKHSASLTKSLRLASILIRKHMRLWFRSSTRVSHRIYRFQAPSCSKKNGHPQSYNLPSSRMPFVAISRVRIAHSSWQRAIAKSASCKTSPSAQR